MDMEQVLKQLQETATVMAGIQARQAEVSKGHSAWLEQYQAYIFKHDQMMSEMEDELNGLIGYVDGKPQGGVALGSGRGVTRCSLPEVCALPALHTWPIDPRLSVDLLYSPTATSSPGSANQRPS